MKILLHIIVLSLLSSCGEFVGPHYNCKYFIEGICISKSDKHEVSYVRLLDAFLKLEEETSKSYFTTFENEDLTALKYSLIRFINADQWEEHVGNDLRGYTVDTSSYVKYDKEECMARIYVSVHEFMHQVAKFVFDVSHEDNANHNVPGFFLTSIGDNSVEFQVYRHIWFNVCEMSK